MKRHIFLIVLLSCSPSIASLASTKLPPSPVRITSDSAEYHRTQNTALFLGNVIMTQGVSMLTADKVMLYTNKQHKLNKVIATGKPAHFKTINQKNKHQMTATADSISYYPISGEIILKGNGKINDGPNSITGALIRYNRKKETLIAGGNSHQRTKIVITPGTLKE